LVPGKIIIIKVLYGTFIINPIGYKMNHNRVFCTGNLNLGDIVGLMVNIILLNLWYNLLLGMVDIAYLYLMVVDFINLT